MSDPWFKFFPTDWRSDPALRMCGPAARGVWIDLICLMHEASPYGHLLVKGHCPTDAQISVLLGMPPDQFSEILGELEAAGVFSRTRTGVIYSRKMTRDAKKAATARKNGRKGGNPRLSKEREKLASDNPQVKGRDMPQKPEARSQSSSETKVSAPDEVADLKAIVFGKGKEFLGRSGISRQKAGAILGKWVRDHGDAAVIDAIGRAQREGAIDPVSFIEGVFRHKAKTKVDDPEWFGAFGRIKDVG